MTGKVVNIKDTNEYDVYIGRAGNGKDGYFGNPFTDGTRSQRIENFKDYAFHRVLVDPEYRKRVKQLQGKTLGCFCKPRACHGDVLIELADKICLEDDVFE